MRREFRSASVVSAGLARVRASVQQQLTRGDRLTRPVWAQAAAAQGKQLRARITLLAGRLVRPTAGAEIRLAAALELFHQATLVHDDILDHAVLRRSRPTLNHRFGNTVAVLAGDWILTRAVNLLLEDMPRPVQTVVASMTSRVCLGEMQEIFAGRRKIPGRRGEYLPMIANKTASLFAACGEAGVLAAGGSRIQAGCASRFGEAYGMAFQIQDDVLDLSGSRANLGKSAGADLREGRMTLPMIFALEATPPARRKLWDRRLRSGRVSLRNLRHWLEETQALERSREQVRAYAGQACRALESFPDTPARRELAGLAAESWQRKK